MPKSGDILFYEDFVFENGSNGNKLFIVLCAEPYCLALKTTSDKPEYYRGAREGCNTKQKVFYIPKEKKEGFPLDTYVQFPKLIEITIPDLIKGGLSKKIQTKKPISNRCLQLIKDCLKNFKDDISDEHWEYIFADNPNIPSINSLQKLASKFKK